MLMHIIQICICAAAHLLACMCHPDVTLLQLPGKCWSWCLPGTNVHQHEACQLSKLLLLLKSKQTTGRLEHCSTLPLTAIMHLDTAVFAVRQCPLKLCSRSASDNIENEGRMMRGGPKSRNGSIKQ